MNEDVDAVPHVHEENEVDEEPHHPSGEAAHLQAAQADHRGLAPDRRHAAFIPVNEGGTGPCFRLGGDELGDELAHLNGRRRHAWHNRALGVGQGHEIARSENFGMTGQAEIRQHFDTTAAIKRNTGQGARDFTGLHARGPDDDVGLDALAGHLHKAPAHLLNRGV